MKAVIFIAKHASSLYFPFGSAESKAKLALIHADMDFGASKIGLKIQEHLAAASHGYSVDQFAHFIMATDIGLFILTFVKIISY